MIPLHSRSCSPLIAQDHDCVAALDKEKRDFPHLLPLKEGGEGNPLHLHFSLYFLHQHDNDLVQSMKYFVASVLTSFICFHCIVKRCCAAGALHFFFFSEINLPVPQIDFLNGKGAVFTQSFAVQRTPT